MTEPTLSLTWHSGVNDGLSTEEKDWLRISPKRRIVMVSTTVWARDMPFGGSQGRYHYAKTPEDEALVLSYLLTGEGTLLTGEDFK